jgi:REP element-mobilizing transposase RayT
LPREVLLRFEAERAARLRTCHTAQAAGRLVTDTEETIIRDFHRAVERYLDQGAGACHLRRPEIADLVVGALKYFHEQRYLFREWVVMPNHVHVLLWPMPNHLLGQIVKSWKQFTSLRVKRMLGLPGGRFWQPESFDHWVRNDEEGARIANYIRHNPVEARLCARPEDWRWSSAWRGEAESRTFGEPP